MAAARGRLIFQVKKQVVRWGSQDACLLAIPVLARTSHGWAEPASAVDKNDTDRHEWALGALYASFRCARAAGLQSRASPVVKEGGLLASPSSVDGRSVDADPQELYESRRPQDLCEKMEGSSTCGCPALETLMQCIASFRSCGGPAERFGTCGRSSSSPPVPEQ